MSAIPIPSPLPTASSHRSSVDCAATHRANAQHSTGPSSEAGKQRAPLNALRRGFTAAAAVLPSQGSAAYKDRHRRFFEEYQPAAPTQSQLVPVLVDTSWLLNRIPLLEAEVLSRNATWPTSASQARASPVSSQKSLHTLRNIQADRTQRERRDLPNAAALLELHKHKGVPWEPADHGFVFSKDFIERVAPRKKHLDASPT
jgi:hypothetical protein